MAERLNPDQRRNHLLHVAISIANANNTVRVTYAQIAVAANVSEATVRGYFGNRNSLWEMIRHDSRANPHVIEDAAIIGL